MNDLYKELKKIEPFTLSSQERKSYIREYPSSRWWNLNMKKEVLAYLAGFLDGDGSIYFIIRKKGIEPRIAFTNNSRELIEEIRSLINSKHITFWERHRINPNARETYHIRIGGLQDIKNFLEQILPYLRRKRPQAELMLEFCSSRLRRMKKGIRYYSEREKEIAKEVTKLNKRGR